MRRSGHRAWAIGWLLAASVTFAAVASAQSIDGFSPPDYREQRERFTPAGGAAIDLRFVIARDAARHAPRVVATTQAALTVLSAWFGPLAPSLTVAGVSWRGQAGAAASPGVVWVPLRWLAPVRDQSTERAVISGLVRQYWIAPAPSGFDGSLIAYTGARAIHQLLEGSHFAAPRFFGGVVPFALRSLLLSPPVADPRPRPWRFDELAPAGGISADHRRGVQALQTLERVVGWPTMLEAVSRLRLMPSSERTPAALAAILSDTTGADLRSLALECFRADAVFDYAVTGLHSEPGPSGLLETTVSIGRPGSGRFAIHADSGDREMSMPLLVRFADGSEARDYFDGAAASATMVYSASSVAVSAAVDPDRTLLLDINRDNNVIAGDARTAPLGVRLALHWLAWLQNAMLSYTALL